MGATVLKGSMRLAAIAVAAASLAACATVQPSYTPRSRTTADGAKVGAPYQVGGVWYVPREQPDYDAVGLASWYGQAFQMKPTANGEIFDMNAVTAAHTTLPLPCIVEVTNLDNGRRLQVRVNDRGPFVDGRIIDLSHEAARELGYDRRGLARVRVRYVGPAQPPFGDVGRRYAPNELKSPNLPAPDVAPAPLELAQAEPMSEAPVATAPSEVESAPAEVQVEVQVPAAAPPPAPSELSPGDLRGASPPAAVAAPAMGYRIQVGAFSDPVNARRAVRLLAPVTQAMIEPVARPGGILYRVLAVGPVGQAEALVLRDRLAQMGFPDARVVPPAGH